jgi:Leucine-rich repeat (LRR) protein
MADVTEDFLARSYAVLRPHIDTLRRNRWLRGIQSQRLLRWETGKPPTDNGEMMLVSPQNDIADTLREMAPHARRMLLELQEKTKYSDFPVMLAFFDLMRRWGADPDPEGILRMVAGHMAKGPEISVEEAIQIRCAFQSRNSLKLSRLPLTDASLSVIPDTVTKLALVDTPVTDACISHLLKLTDLMRLNIAGTQITDNGLVALGDLQNLEWVCVNRTQVTTVGVKRLKVIRPNVTVLIGSEP